jgi:hypothetical protein
MLDRASEVALSAPLIAQLLLRVDAARLLAAKAGDRAIAALHEAERNLTHTTACQPCSIGYHVSAALVAARSGDLADAHQTPRHGRAERRDVAWKSELFRPNLDRSTLAIPDRRLMSGGLVVGLVSDTPKGYCLQ